MKTSFRSLSVILYLPTLVQSLTDGVDVYDNIENCDGNFSGPECDIPFELCDDNKHKCFNNSKCKKSTKVDPVTEEIAYLCDCSFAASAGSKFAGRECEHSDTEICKDAKEGQGSTFCTNGGSCMSFIYDSNTRWGCACPSDFVGSHCQYLSVDVKKGLVGEARFDDVHENFWSFIPTKTKMSKASGIAAGIAISAISMITLAFGMVIMKRRRSIAKNEAEREQQQQNSKELGDDAEVL
mmetsp:Transcript_19549/g.24639  ORF Transcript_19549/g.24639 Transcript_19549/m.24639 type:complete len:239 (+) Transcript_19549:102-818(+)